MLSSSAGGSADDRARQLREDAERLIRQAERWEQGAQGERETARLLAPLSAEGYRVLHDGQVPGSPANIDHLVIGPTGVFVIDSKRFSSRVSTGNGTVWTGSHPLAKSLETLRWERDQAAAALPIPAGIAVHAAMAIHARSMAFEEHADRDVLVVRAEVLCQVIRRGAAVLSPAQHAEIAAVAKSGLRMFEYPPGTGPGSDVPLTVADVLRASTRPPKEPAARARRRRPSPRPAAAPRRARPARATAPTTQSIPRALVSLAVFTALALGTPQLMKAFTNETKVGPAVAPPPSASAPAPGSASVATPAMTERFDCLVRGEWRLVIGFPPLPAGYASYEIELRREPAWRGSAQWDEPTREWRLDGVPPSAEVYVRVHMAGPNAPATEKRIGTFRAPPTGC